MSYILEALKKAEAERNGAVHKAAPLLPPLATKSKTPPPWRRPLPVAALAALAVTLACAAWFSVSSNAPPQPLPPAPAPVPAPVAAVVPPAEPEPAVAEPEKPKEKPAPKKAAEKKRPPPPEEPKTAKAPAPEPAVGSLQDLPVQIQREIPSLAVGGYIYSGNKADRSVLVNNRLLHEGDEAAPGLVLEKMTASGMVLNYKGYRYRRGY
ncbi:general secretion pathway protein GspB [Noviherbaspirillum sp. ST9]|uniref:general secretion pathway protein GspB n=1 Tax=Noviherbaspirillum sp. ST9 TaxID=3401606 RepID=UPI003B5867DB